MTVLLSRLYILAFKFWRILGFWYEWPILDSLSNRISDDNFVKLSYLSDFNNVSPFYANSNVIQVEQLYYIVWHKCHTWIVYYPFHVLCWKVERQCRPGLCGAQLNILNYFSRRSWDCAASEMKIRIRPPVRFSKYMNHIIWFISPIIWMMTVMLVTRLC